MINIKTGKTYFVPVIGNYRLFGDDEKKPMVSKSSKKAYEIANKYFLQWGGR